MAKNRVIKFRVWDGTVMDHEPSIWGTQETGECFLNVGIKYAQEVSGIVFMQFTGLRDIKGVEIFEGDIVLGERQVTPRKIIYCEGMWMRTKVTKAPLPSAKRYPLSGQAVVFDRLSVIGNIYENPELLKDGTQG